MQAILTAGLHVGRDRSSIVVSLHNDQARAKDHQEGKRVLLPVGVDHNASGGRLCGQVGLGVLYAPRGGPPDSSFEADDLAEAVRGVSASTHTHASGVRISPVGTHSQVIRAVLRIVRSLLFIVSPFLGASGRDRAPRLRRGWAAARTIGWGGGGRGWNYRLHPSIFKL